MTFLPQKSLGQNFLKDRSYLQPIVEAAELSQSDTVLEIGPGFGVLTEELAKRVKLVLAVEKDFRLVEQLRKKFKNQSSKVKIIHEDILRFDLATFPENYKVVANLPFNITSPVIKKLIEGPRPKLAVLTVQKEVAERLTAPPGNSERGIVTVFLERYAPTELITTIPKTAFEPQPEVDAAVIKLVPTNQPLDRVFERIVKAGFSAKRRQIHNSLKGSLKLSQGQVSAMLERTNVEPKKRAEDLNVSDWQALGRAFAHVFT